jgi:hypothetical protein
MEADLAPAAWRTSSYSGGSGNCVEVTGSLPGVVGVRDSKDPGGRALVFTTAAWRAFAGQVRSGGPASRSLRPAGRGAA